MPTQPPGAYGALAVNGGNPATLYVATSLGLMRSQDGGKNWHRKDAGLPEGTAGVRALLPVPNKPQEWYAATGDGLYSSANEGVSWQRVALQGQNLAALAASAAPGAGASRLYVLTTQGAVYRLESATLPR